MLLLLVSLLACRPVADAQADPPPPPAAVRSAIQAHLVSAVDHAAQADTASALADWRRAHAGFEAYVEPTLGPRRLATEYALGQLRQALADGDADRAARLLEQLDTLQ